MNRIERVVRYVQDVWQDRYEQNPCPECGGSGTIIEMVDYYGDGDPIPMARRCTCVEARLLEARRQRSGITEAFLKKTFGTFKLEGRPEAVVRAYETARAYVEAFPEKSKEGASLALLGASGSGKTHLACAVANALMERGVDVVYFPYTERIRELRQHRFDDQWQEEHGKRFKECGLLLIDDLFKSTPERFDFEVMFEILNYRYFEAKPFVVSSELTPDRLLAMDAAIAGRIIERCRGFLAVLMDPRGNSVLNYRLVSEI